MLPCGSGCAIDAYPNDLLSRAASGTDDPEELLISGVFLGVP